MELNIYGYEVLANSSFLASAYEDGRSPSSPNLPTNSVGLLILQPSGAEIVKYLSVLAGIWSFESRPVADNRVS